MHSGGHWPKSWTLSLVWDSFQIHKCTHLIQALWFNETVMLASPHTALNDIAIFLLSPELCPCFPPNTTLFPSLSTSCGTTTFTWLSPSSPRSLCSWRTSQVTKNPRSSTSECSLWDFPTITRLLPPQRDIQHSSPLVWSSCSYFRWAKSSFDVTPGAVEYTLCTQL